MIFVFGSNTGGIHGAGAAHYAKQHHGAVMGQGIGHHGNSYAIPTKSHVIRKGQTCVGDTLELNDIRKHVSDFFKYATANRDLTFQVTRIGCGLAGLQDKDVAPMFFEAPYNCQFDSKWTVYFDHLGYLKKSDWMPDFWGTF